MIYWLEVTTLPPVLDSTLEDYDEYPSLPYMGKQRQLVVALMIAVVLTLPLVPFMYLMAIGIMPLPTSLNFYLLPCSGLPFLWLPVVLHVVLSQIFLCVHYGIPTQKRLKWMLRLRSFRRFFSLWLFGAYCILGLFLWLVFSWIAVVTITNPIKLGPLQLLILYIGFYIREQSSRISILLELDSKVDLGASQLKLNDIKMQKMSKEHATNAAEVLPVNGNLLMDYTKASIEKTDDPNSMVEEALNAAYTSIDNAPKGLECQMWSIIFKGLWGIFGPAFFVAAYALMHFSGKSDEVISLATTLFLQSSLWYFNQSFMTDDAFRDEAIKAAFAWEWRKFQPAQLKIGAEPEKRDKRTSKSCCVSRNETRKQHGNKAFVLFEMISKKKKAQEAKEAKEKAEKSAAEKKKMEEFAMEVAMAMNMR